MYRMGWGDVLDYIDVEWRHQNEEVPAGTATSDEHTEKISS